MEEGNSVSQKQDISEKLIYKHQSIITTPSTQGRLLRELGDKLKDSKVLFEFINFFPQFQDATESRVITHNVKLEEIKKIAK